MSYLTTSAPTFPENVPTHPLVTIDYLLIRSGDEYEIDILWNAVTQLGFWYLKNHGAEEEVDRMFAMGAETLDLPLSEKMKYEQGDDGFSFGYKARGTIATDKNGTKDNIEFLNIAQDDALSWPLATHRTYPAPVNVRMEGTIVPFVRKSMAVADTLLAVFERRLGLPEGEIRRLHSLEETCGSEARCVKTPPNQNSVGLGEHTDFGTLTILHNRLGGLQVLPPGSKTWQYVKPVPGNAICNIGDALAIFSGGILQSGIHRVMPPPGAQSQFERYSVAFFTRANDSVILRALGDKSVMIHNAVAEASAEHFDTGSRSVDWVARRIRKLRLRNRKGQETWFASLGTEHQGVERLPGAILASA
ncbi:Clavaminate synthase-like protein [Amylocystis lapponica]|nr:Clavaminate synthase-like protein [Amylocystis lapponica]